ncbi:MAG: hypothetical protein DRI84_04215 [Bacteroidetes bacterium]|nr:MAG: hypothetical protein DRI84_04215 [Bacteroidota bacterium]
MKYILPILVLLLSMFYQDSSAQCPLDLGQSPNVSTNGLTIYFPFNGNVTNQGSGSYTATVSGATYSTGICGQGMYFDGIDDNIQVNPYVPLTSDFTIAAWVYVDSLTQNLAVFATRDQCPTTYRGFSQGEFGINYYTAAAGGSNRIRYVINTHQNCTGWSAGDRYYVQNYTYSSGSWHFVAITVQGNITDSRIIKVYVDCQQYSMYQYYNYNTTPSFSPNNNNKSFIGAATDIAPWNYTFNGTIDEFRIYNRAITSTEMLDLYYQCKPLEVTINKHIGICSGDSATIEIINAQKGISYQLFDSTNQQLLGIAQTGGCNNLVFNTGLVTTATNFYIKAINANCQIVLDTVVSLNPSAGSGYTIYDSIELCDGDSIFLKGQFFTAPTIVYDSLLDINYCDSVIITSLLSLPLPLIDLGNDTTFCDGDSVLLSISNNYYSVLWSNGLTNNNIYINTTGTYWVEVSDSICINSDSIDVINLTNTYIQINDTSFCDGEIWTINLPTYNSYLWSNGSTGSQVTIKDSGQYWVTVTDICKSYTENFGVQIIDCSCMMAVPNVFTPNRDGINDYFFPVINCIFDEYHIVIYNRWGQLLFESSNQNEKWDGNYRGGEVPDGVYFYLITYKYLLTSDQEGQRSGSITIFR